MRLMFKCIFKLSKLLVNMRHRLGVLSNSRDERSQGLANFPTFLSDLLDSSFPPDLVQGNRDSNDGKDSRSAGQRGAGFFRVKSSN